MKFFGILITSEMIESVKKELNRDFARIDLNKPPVPVDISNFTPEEKAQYDSIVAQIEQLPKDNLFSHHAQSQHPNPS